MALVNTREFWIIGVAVGIVLIIGMAYAHKGMNGGGPSETKTGGRRRRPRHMKKRRH
jgi:hypothetical protein